MDSIFGIWDNHPHCMCFKIFDAVVVVLAKKCLEV